MSLKLSDLDQALLSGEQGDGSALAMRVVTRVAAAMGASSLLDISAAHIDSCLDHGQAGLDFADSLRSQGCRVSVPTTLNVSSLDLLHPELYLGTSDQASRAATLMNHYESMGCKPTWTCAPYQTEARPGFGEHVAWAESNAIVFANSVLGARTHRYGDFIDICAAITGRAPAAGLHLDECRQAEVVFDLSLVPERLTEQNVLYPVLGQLIGEVVGPKVPVIVGLPPNLSEDRLKAIGAAAASSGSVGLFHCVGSTPEAPDLATAIGSGAIVARIEVDLEMLCSARDRLSTTNETALGIVSLGTPHYSVSEFENLLGLLAGRAVHPEVDMYVSTGRDVLGEVQLRGWVKELEGAGIQLVTDTCTYITPLMKTRPGVAMTDSGKWAYYAPGNLGLEVVFGATADCVESAVAGRVLRDTSMWSQ